MIAVLRGRVLHSTAGEVVVGIGSDATGWVGYRVRIPARPDYQGLLGSASGASTVTPATPATPLTLVSLEIYTHVREDALDLYGFQSAEERTLFETLMSVNGIGCRVALSVLSASDPHALTQAIVRGDRAYLTALPGVGKKTAERIVLELGEKLKKQAPFSSGATSVRSPLSGDEAIWSEARLALGDLGYREQEVERMIDKIRAENSAVADSKAFKLEDVIRKALQWNA